MKRSINLEAVFAIYGFTDLLQNSPKFTHLLRFLLQHQEEKHIIITRYRRFAGLEILSLLIRGLGLPLVELNLRTPDKFLLCEQFSQVKSGIMVCTMVPPMGIKNVRHLHFLDGSLGNFDNFLSILFKYHLYDGEPKLTVHNHIATAPGIETPDLLSYFKFGQKMEKKMCLWQNQIFRGKKILQKEDRLEVVD